MEINLIYIILLSAMLVALSLAPIGFELFQKRLDPFNPRNLFILYFALQLGIYPIFIIFSRQNFRMLDSASPSETHLMILALLVSIVGILAFHIGYGWGFGRRWFPGIPPTIIRGARAGIVAVASIPIVTYSIYGAFLSRGGLGGYIDNFVEIRYTGGGINGYLFYMASSYVAIVAVLLFLAGLHSKSARVFKFSSILSFLVALVFTGITGFRSAMVPVVLTAAACYHYYIRRLSVLASLVAVALLAMLLAAYGAVRAQIESRSAQQDIETYGRAGLLESFLVRSPGIELVAITVGQVNEQKNFKYFLPALWEAATIVIPRNLWEDKPLPQGLVYGREFLDYYLFLRTGVVSNNTGGNSMTVIGYLYWQLGAAAVMGGMLGLGLFFGASYRLFCEHRNSCLVAFIYLGLYGSLPKFAEAPQETVNLLVITSFFVVPFAFFCAGKSQYLGPPSCKVGEKG